MWFPACRDGDKTLNQSIFPAPVGFLRQFVFWYDFARMAYQALNFSGYLLRFIGALVVVFVSYNPEGYSFYHWARNTLPEPDPLLIFAGVVILIGWTILLRATIRSLGAFGLLLAFGFFGTLLWVLIDFDVIPAHSTRAITYLVLVVLSGVLATGVSWSHVRRRITGQGDVDEVDN